MRMSRNVNEQVAVRQAMRQNYKDRNREADWRNQQSNINAEKQLAIRNQLVGDFRVSFPESYIPARPKDIPENHRKNSLGVENVAIAIKWIDNVSAVISEVVSIYRSVTFDSRWKSYHNFQEAINSAINADGLQYADWLVGCSLDALIELKYNDKYVVVGYKLQKNGTLLMDPRSDRPINLRGSLGAVLPRKSQSINDHPMVANPPKIGFAYRKSVSSDICDLRQVTCDEAHNLKIFADRLEKRWRKMK